MRTQKNCAFHPNRRAVTKCENCGIPICRNCVIIYEYVKDPVTKVQKDFCPEYKDYKTRVDNLTKICVFIAIIIGFIYIMFFIANNF